ncbi:type IV pilin protein [Thermoanaerobacterium sp. DL9XJH110]|uniref:type IV pilin protein n=1 Tax=Thermoanaerobacterium sp. DL9XJH110 TaxID=3386643 RepID=UPI003BB7996A
MFIKMAKRLHKEEKGFTLIELIVVVAVLGILATIAVPRVIGVKKDAEDSAEQANLAIIKNALERYYAENGEYPDELDDLVNDYIDEIPQNIKDNYTYDNEDGTLTKK